jgi:hypothetical protein
VPSSRVPVFECGPRRYQRTAWPRIGPNLTHRLLSRLYTFRST